MRNAQEADSFCQEKLQMIRREITAKKPAKKRGAKWSISENGLLCRSQRIYVPPGMHTELLMLTHDDPAAGHQGVSKSLRRLQAQYYWPSMKKDVKDHIRICATCQRTKPRLHRPYGYLASLPVPIRPWEEISMDFITDLPPVTREKGRVSDSILVIVDRFTKYSLFVPTSKRLTAEGLATLFLERVFQDYGLPKGIVTDRGSLFTS
ncbi:hypothetical protein AK830_g12707, partial [Neonectria ditissima]